MLSASEEDIPGETSSLSSPPPPPPTNSNASPSLDYHQDNVVSLSGGSDGESLGGVVAQDDNSMEKSSSFFSSSSSASSSSSSNSKAKKSRKGGPKYAALNQTEKYSMASDTGNGDVNVGLLLPVDDGGEGVRAAMMVGGNELDTTVIGGGESGGSGGQTDGSSSQKKTSMAGASFNFINSIVGAGIVGMPFALRLAGFGLGIFLILAMGALTDYSVNLLVKSGRLAGKMNYQELVQISFGVSQ